MKNLPEGFISRFELKEESANPKISQLRLSSLRNRLKRKKKKGTQPQRHVKLYQVYQHTHYESPRRKEERKMSIKVI